jgi:hypothetical protein
MKFVEFERFEEEYEEGYEVLLGVVGCDLH